METSSWYFRIPRKEIAYFKFIIESHEGMAVVRTHDPGEAIVELVVAPGWGEDLEVVLARLRQEMAIEPLSGMFNKRSGSPANPEIIKT